LFLLAWRNVTRRKNQTIITILITFIAILTFVTTQATISVLNEGVQLANSRLGADVIVLPHTVRADAFQTILTADPVNIYMNESIIDDIRKLPGVEQITPQFFAQTLNQSCCTVGGAKRLVGFDESSDFVIWPWLSGEERIKLAPDQILVGGAVPPMLGGKAVILGEGFWVADRLETTGTGMDETIFLDINVAREIAKASPYLKSLWVEEPPDHLISAALIRVEEGVDPALLADVINNSDIKGNAVAVGRVISRAKDQMDNMTKFLFLLWGAVAITAALGLFGRFNSLARERKKEIGIFRAIGGQRSGAFGLILFETLLMVVTGGLLGSLTAVFLIQPLLDWIRELAQLPQGTWSIIDAVYSTLLGLGIAIALGVASAIYPAWKSASLEPQEAISSGGLD